MKNLIFVFFFVCGVGNIPASKLLSITKMLLENRNLVFIKRAQSLYTNTEEESTTIAIVFTVLQYYSSCRL